jgi:hypothetical protein
MLRVVPGRSCVHWGRTRTSLGPPSASRACYGLSCAVTPVSESGSCACFTVDVLLHPAMCSPMVSFTRLVPLCAARVCVCVCVCVCVYLCLSCVVATDCRCAGGTYPNLRDEVREGSTSCIACGPGTYLPPAPSGWETNPQTACSPCPAGKVAPSYGMSECTSKAACVCALHARASVAAVLYVC